jgi:diguanylate cyclase (GGDEF)-like protein
MLFRLAFDRPVTDETYVELVRSLAGTVSNTALFGVLFSIVAVWAAARDPDPVVLASGSLGIALAVVRLAVLVRVKPTLCRPEIEAGEARHAERKFGATYLAFAALLGLFAGRIVQVASLELELLITALIVGYAAGVAAGLSLRPWLSVPATAFVVVPVITASLLRGGAHHLLLALVLTGLLAGGIANMLVRYRSEIEKIHMRQLLGTLARQDHLTGLPNRLALSDALASTEARGCASVAVHCLDLDGFKQVNDQHGHPAGDVLLQQVAGRLESLIRKDDMAARLGGDEFIVFQAGIADASEAELMARRVVRALREPYFVDGKELSVGVSVGYAIAEQGSQELRLLLGRADRALYRVKLRGGGAAARASDEEGGNVVRLASRG